MTPATRDSDDDVTPATRDSSGSSPIWSSSSLSIATQVLFLYLYLDFSLLDFSISIFHSRFLSTNRRTPLVTGEHQSPALPQSILVSVTNTLDSGKNLFFIKHYRFNLMWLIRFIVFFNSLQSNVLEWLIMVSLKMCNLMCLNG